MVGMVTLANAGIQTTHMKSNPKRKINDTGLRTPKETERIQPF